MNDTISARAGQAAFSAAFEKACKFSPYDYQIRLATGTQLPELLNIPTGLGKTAAVVFAWIWRRLFAEEDVRRQTPRRLVYCLPMRVLVEQTSNNIRQWLKNLGLASTIHVHILMGGEDTDDWDSYPERDATRRHPRYAALPSLNRGYAMSRYRWPMHFGLLNNDCLWVMDETQLMGVGVESSAQLAAFRKSLGTHGNSETIWMSATLGQAQLATVDHPKPPGGSGSLELGPVDLAKPEVRRRIRARKTITKLDLALSKERATTYPKGLARIVLSKHQTESFTLVVVNRVARAQEIYEELLKQGRTESNTALIHSRFREDDRKVQERILFGKGDRIVVATQAIEAGVDISAQTLITELAPWPSLVQRFGDAIAMASLPRRRPSGPYRYRRRRRRSEDARSALKLLANAAPETLKQVSVAVPVVTRPVLRRKDLLDLFDTTPDLCGNDLDVSRYIRDGQDTDVQLFWRQIGDETPSRDEPEPARGELVRVSVSQFRKFLEKTRRRDGIHWKNVGTRLFMPDPARRISLTAPVGAIPSAWAGRAIPGTCRQHRSQSMLTARRLTAQTAQPSSVDGSN